MDTKCHLELNPKGVDADQKLYRSMIGSFLYLCASRPDIVLSVGVCVQGIKQLLNTATCRLSIGSSDIWLIPQGLGCDTQRAPISLLLVTQI